MDTKEKIMAAAIKLFATKGRHGTRMEEVGAVADVNKAMVYYYYNSKDNLYFEVLKTILAEHRETEPNEINGIGSDNVADYIEMVKKVVKKQFTLFLNDPDGAKILLDALINTPRMIFDAIQGVMRHGDDTVVPYQEQLLNALNRGKENRIFRDIDPNHTFISIIGMTTVYQLVGKSIAQNFLNLKVEDEEAFLREREEAILDLVLYGIVGRDK